MCSIIIIILFQCCSLLSLSVGVSLQYAIKEINLFFLAKKEINIKHIR